MQIMFKCEQWKNLIITPPYIEVYLEFPGNNGDWIPYLDYKSIDAIEQFFSLAGLFTSGINIAFNPQSVTCLIDYLQITVEGALEILKLSTENNWKEGGPPEPSYLYSNIPGIITVLNKCQVMGYTIKMPIKNKSEKSCDLDIYVSYQCLFEGIHSTELTIIIPSEN